MSNRPELWKGRGDDWCGGQDHRTGSLWMGRGSDDCSGGSSGSGGNNNGGSLSGRLVEVTVDVEFLWDTWVGFSVPHAGGSISPSPQGNGLDIHQLRWNGVFYGGIWVIQNLDAPLEESVSLEYVEFPDLGLYFYIGSNYNDSIWSKGGIFFPDNMPISGTHRILLQFR